MNVWPLTLPQAPFRDFDASPATGLTSHPDESNNPIRTRTYPEHEVEFAFKQLTLAQLQAFRTFYDDTLNQTGPFSAPWLPDAGYVNHFLRIVPPPKITKNGRNFDVQIVVEVVCSVPMTGGNIAYWIT
jgi:hypothetical protein